MNEAIIIKEVSKKFKIHHDKSSTLKEKILFNKCRNSTEDRWVLNDVNLSINHGECIGLIGENGSGKSTLLKLMTRIIYPTSGSIGINGKVSSLLELGAGFHPNMTGLENIYTNASIFGLSRKEIDDRVDEIIAFSELGEYIDNPVRTYSSGMYMRLAFSVAINVQADILLIDEILAVGDANFQAKCFNKLRELKANGTTIVIVSHDLGSIEKLCHKSVWIADGRIKKAGDPYDVHAEYLDFMGKKQIIDSTPEENYDDDGKLELDSNDQQVNSTSENERWGNGDIIIREVMLYNSEGQNTRIFESGKPASICFKYKKRKSKIDKDITFGVGIFRNDGVHCYGTNTFIDHIGDFDIKEEGQVCFNIYSLNFLEGEYTIDIAIHKEDGFAYDYHRKITSFKVYSTIKDAGVARLDHKWEIK